MKSTMYRDIANLSAGASVTSGGMMGFLSANAAALGVLISTTTLVMGFIFYLLNYRLNRQKMKLKGEQLALDNKLLEERKALDRRRKGEDDA